MARWVAKSNGNLENCLRLELSSSSQHSERHKSTKRKTEVKGKGCLIKDERSREYSSVLNDREGQFGGREGTSSCQLLRTWKCYTTTLAKISVIRWCDPVY